MKFYLDDIRKPPPGWEYASTYQAGLDLLEKHRGQWEIASLDHDLGDYLNGVERTGYDFVQEMAKRDIWPNEIYVHSINYSGRQRMLAFIREENKRRRIVRGSRRIGRPRNHTGCNLLYCFYCPDRLEAHRFRDQEIKFWLREQRRLMKNNGFLRRPLEPTISASGTNRQAGVNDGK